MSCNRFAPPRDHLVPLDQTNPIEEFSSPLPTRASSAEALSALAQVQGNWLGAPLAAGAQAAALAPAHLPEHEAALVVGLDGPRQRSPAAAHGFLQLSLQLRSGLATWHAARQQALHLPHSHPYYHSSLFHTLPAKSSKILLLQVKAATTHKSAKISPLGVVGPALAKRRRALEALRQE